MSASQSKPATALKPPSPPHQNRQDGDGDLRIAVLLPCHNEGQTIGEVVADFRAALPTADIYVYDNNSNDDTAIRARLAGATVMREPRQGKGHVVRRMFADIDADIYVMADGDGTYDPAAAPDLITTLLTEKSDMVVGARSGIHQDAGRSGHALGNRVFNLFYRALFGEDFSDIFSGYRAFTHRFVKSFPAVSGGFEIETEISVHASQLQLPISELQLSYGRRPEGSQSKLSTFKDGFRIAWMFLRLMKATQPLRLFSWAAAVLFLASVTFMTPPVVEYLTTGLVNRVPMWIGAVGILLLAVLTFMAGLILQSVALGRSEAKRLVYLAQKPRQVEISTGQFALEQWHPTTPGEERSAKRGLAKQGLAS
ncbi:MAG: glycosyltransferase [Pseudomonadota bacterium]